MTRRPDVLSKLLQVAGLAIQLPDGARVTIEWDDASPDLILLLALQDDGVLRTSVAEGVQNDEAEWTCGGVLIRARRSIAAPVNAGPPKLTLVKP